MMRATVGQTFTLNNFEGPLDFLLHLVQKQEIDISDISLQDIVLQFINKLDVLTDTLDAGGEFVSLTASLLWIKSKMLLPRHEQQEEIEEEGPDPRFEIIHQLIDYCKFKEAAKTLLSLEEKKTTYFPRGIIDTPIVKRPLGIEHLSLQDFASLFEQMIKKASHHGLIKEEEWKVGDKIRFLRQGLKTNSKIEFEELFSIQMSKGELIVIFLAILELMKLGELRIIKETESGQISIIASS